MCVHEPARCVVQQEQRGKSSTVGKEVKEVLPKDRHTSAYEKGKANEEIAQ